MRSKVNMCITDELLEVSFLYLLDIIVNWTGAARHQYRKLVD